MHPALVVRDFIPADLDAVLALNMHAQDPDADIPSSLRHYPALLDIATNFQRDGAFLVGILDGTLIAMGSVSPVEDRTFEMDYIRVAMPHHRNGYGRRVVQELEQRVR